ncbi:hypothetical protein RvY_10192-2 [Ramazzottius varieornatus]|uniref:Retinol dehydrogenase 14 n=1 Tax=Ramazzottius varieornatus TaxID=947166 RepID=A0A1D1VGG5_RAMVA|nr:hypothetical protein RvY_10192-2 [Ramazzottius varieornatus]
MVSYGGSRCFSRRLLSLLLKGHTFILTGATNAGVGKETARELAIRGATVILGAKNLDRCHQARHQIITSTNFQNREIECVPLDLKSLSSIRKFVQNLPKDLPVDALVNAAETIKKDSREETVDGLEKQMGVSHFGHFLLTNLVVEKFNTIPGLRIVNIAFPSSKEASINFDDLNSEKDYNPSRVYRQAKLATLLTTLEASKRFGHGVTVNAVYPGQCNTEIYRHVSGNQSFIVKILMQPLFMFLFKSPERAAQTVLYAALNKDLEGVTGKYVADCMVKELPIRETEAAQSKRLWEVSREIVEGV